MEDRENEEEKEKEKEKDHMIINRDEIWAVWNILRLKEQIKYFNYLILIEEYPFRGC